ncbi:MAG: hypothetical protein AUI42_06050 [Actinobacteria bacterium 13_1_40CM_2_65_8]|nr:MAG: hypothetical protein AUH40_10845 [Chloroflexi bacterium 13_1_40CM_65_17]OLD49844.1 MAG: hypothetical protein AUI42_06050 [Actinobacteria bacterium 13_1_40CM_2_65_8]
MNPVRVLLLSVLLFIAAFGAHEVMHLLVLYALGGHGSMIVRPWRLGLVDATILSLHVQPDQPIGLGRQLLVNFLGPVLAAVPLAVLLVYVREPVVRLALWANVTILAFYALIEAGDLITESIYDLDLSILTTPEFNYGVPALIVLIATVIAFRHDTDVHVATG